MQIYIGKKEEMGRKKRKEAKITKIMKKGISIKEK